MKKLTISEEEKKNIIEQYQTPPKDATEQIIWDDASLNAVKSYNRIGEPDRKFTIQVEEPFLFETTKADEYHTLKHILIRTHTKFTHKEEKI